MISADVNGAINFFRCQTDLIDPDDGEWLHDLTSSEECTEMIGLLDKGEKLVENHISPDGRFILSCMEG